MQRPLSAPTRNARRSRRRGGLALWVALLGVALSSSRAGASAASSAARDNAEARAKALFERGQAQFETADYEGAIESFTRAYEEAIRIEDTQFRAVVSATLQFNLAGAHIKAYEINDDPKHLGQARALLLQYREREAFSEEERVAADELLAVVDKLLAEVSEVEEDPAPAPVEPATPVEPSSPPEPTSPRKPGAGLVIGGAVVAGASLVGFGLMAGGLVIGDNAVDEFLGASNGAERTAAINRGERGNSLAIAGGVLGGALLATGAALIIVGKSRQRADGLALAPALAPGFAGLLLRGEF